LNLFKEIGLQVTFLPNNFNRFEPYTSILQQNGIEVLYGKIYKNFYENWLKDNLKYFKYVYLQRPDISNVYIDIIMKYIKEKLYILHMIFIFSVYIVNIILHIMIIISKMLFLLKKLKIISSLKLMLFML